MAFDYAKSRNTAQRLIAKFGQTVTFTKTSGGGGTDQFGNPISETSETFTGDCTPVLPMGGVIKSLTVEEQSQIANGDGYVFFHSDSQLPIGATATVGGKDWKVKEVIKSLTSVDGTNVFRSYHLTKV